MPESFFSLFPHFQTCCEAVKIPTRIGVDMIKAQQQMVALGFDLFGGLQSMGFSALGAVRPLGIPLPDTWYRPVFGLLQEEQKRFLAFARAICLDSLERIERRQSAEVDFIDLFTGSAEGQEWTFPLEPTRLLLELPGLRLHDISASTDHTIDNYTVVFAPRAGHHSNIAERVALYLRDKGLSRMAVVEQKCADEIPVTVDGRRHYENFDGQIDQYRQVLEKVRKLTGRPAHLIAVCQPGPLLIATLIRYPHLGRTFGSAGSPMDTEAGSGYLTDFARQVGPDYIDRLIQLFGKTVTDATGKHSREVYDGRFQVLGFYLLGLEQHLRNFRKLHLDMKRGNLEGAQRQKAFYHWYNYVLHFPAGFIRDTFKKIFVNNDLIRGRLTVHGKTVRIQDYPPEVPIWALGGSRDDIAPPLQATGHMDRVPVSADKRLNLICDGGHMGLFRSTQILDNEYRRIRDFLLANSDRRSRGRSIGGHENSGTGRNVIPHPAR